MKIYLLLIWAVIFSFSCEEKEQKVPPDERPLLSVEKSNIAKEIVFKVVLSSQKESIYIMPEDVKVEPRNDDLDYTTVVWEKNNRYDFILSRFQGSIIVRVPAKDVNLWIVWLRKTKKEFEEEYGLRRVLPKGVEEKSAEAPAPPKGMPMIGWCLDGC